MLDRDKKKEKNCVYFEWRSCEMTQKNIDSTTFELNKKGFICLKLKGVAC
jgi:hypothetical protein